MSDADSSFPFDVFIGNSPRDRVVVRTLAKRLRADGLRVWFEGWRAKANVNFQAKVEEGLELSRVLILCMSGNVSESDWAKLENYTFRFRDPLNTRRRFIPVRLDDVPIKGSLAQFLWLDWTCGDHEQQYRRLLEACRRSESVTSGESRSTVLRPVEGGVQLDCRTRVFAYALGSDGRHAFTGGSALAVQLWDLGTGRAIQDYYGHEGSQDRRTNFVVTSVAWHAGSIIALSGGTDCLVLVWRVDTGRCVRALEGHRGSVRCVAMSADHRHAVSGSFDATIRVWELGTGHCIRVLEGHGGGVHCIAWNEQQHQILSGSFDATVRLWEVTTGRCVRILEGHSGPVACVAWCDTRQWALSGSEDCTIRHWDVGTGRCLHLLGGHGNHVTCVAWNSNNRHALSGSVDRTLRLWDVETGRCLAVLKGHTAAIKAVAWSADGCRAFSGDLAGGVEIWDLSEFVAESQAPLLPVAALPIDPDQVQYANAKVLLVGDSGVGKSALSNYLVHSIKVDDERPLPSTDGAWATVWKLPNSDDTGGVDREIWLWDFAGQVDYRLVHQLYMEGAAAAVLVFNPQNENPFEGLGQWDRDLEKSSRRPFKKLLVAGRVDRGGLVVSRTSMERFIRERGFLTPLLETSAKTAEGCGELRETILRVIDWESITATTSTALYSRMKEEILKLRDRGIVLIRLAELKQRMELTLAGERFDLAQLETVVGLLAGPGMIQRLAFGGFILLCPEVLSRYAAGVVRKVRKHPQELGCIREDELLAGDLDYQDFERLPLEDEAIVLRTLQETFVKRAWCLRQPCDGTAILTFPSYFRRERKEQPGHPSVLVTYRFTGPVDDIYASLVVRLHYTTAFDTDQLWKDAADFKTQANARLGLLLSRESEGGARLEVYFNPDVDTASRVLFLRYVHNHLDGHAQNVQRLRRYFCGNKKCKRYNQAFADQALIDEALAPSGEGKVFCPGCGKPIILRDVMEEKFNSPAVKEEVRKLQEESQSVIDNESLELILVGHAYSITAEAGQICRGYTNSDHGIDNEIEFKDDEGQATGKRLYLQLKSGDSYLTKRKGDGTEIFKIKKPRWAEYWQQQAYPVMLVIRTSDGAIRWMDVSASLKRESQGGKKVTQIVFDGERFDVMSVRRWRDRVLNKGEESR